MGGCGCFLLIALAALFVLFVVGSVLALFLGPNIDQVPDPTTAERSLTDSVRWDGKYRCGDELRGISLVTRFVGTATSAGAPMSVDITY
ncbi:MAG: hypothetical protein KDB62_10410, partial [Solirubrobacterales bacterium]|nr:hypothetical protein [Solirubrobacterales bacterium]